MQIFLFCWFAQSADRMKIIMLMDKSFVRSTKTTISLLFLSHTHKWYRWTEDIYMYSGGNPNSETVLYIYIYTFQGGTLKDHPG
jgi:hypothetical protein